MGKFDERLAAVIDMTVTLMTALLVVTLYMGAIYSIAIATYSVYAGSSVYFPLVTGSVLAVGAVALSFYISYYYTLRQVARGG
jgi:hypothetical protein